MCKRLIVVILFAHFAAAAELSKRSVDLGWEPVEGAIGYELRIKSLSRENAKPLLFRTKKASWVGRIAPGEYEMNIRSYDKRSVPGPWSEAVKFWAKVPPPLLIQPKPHEVIESGQEGIAHVQFEWANPFQQNKFNLKIISEPAGFEKSVEVTVTNPIVELPVGKRYKWQVQAVHSDGSMGELSPEPGDFTLLAPALPPPNLLVDKSDFMRLVTWEAVPSAEAYSVRLFRSLGKSWTVILEDKKLLVPEVELPLESPQGKYKLEVQALAEGRKPSSVSEQTFMLKGGFR